MKPDVYNLIVKLCNRFLDFCTLVEDADNILKIFELGDKIFKEKD